ncbi:MAG: DoxX subfamily [Bacteroidetes bacterium]|nr:MAG: DoxX subfamily [Bacteroidota bacterium]
MDKIYKYTKTQTIVLVLLRLVIGYHFLEAGFDKLFDPNWTSAAFLLQSNWIFADLFQLMADNQTVLAIVDFLNIGGQILIGLSLIIGLFSTWAAFFGAVLIFFYYIAIPPFVDGYTFIDKNLFELFAFLIIAFFPTSRIIGIDLLVYKLRKPQL